MIEPNELRVGNYLTHKGKNIIVDGIENCTEESQGAWLIWIKDEGLAWPISEFEPVPLTPEILQKCGFMEAIYENEINGYIKYVSDRHWQFDVFLNKENDCCVHFIRTALIKHPQQLHLFQNIVFALTGKELEIKL